MMHEKKSKLMKTHQVVEHYRTQQGYVAHCHRLKEDMVDLSLYYKTQNVEIAKYRMTVESDMNTILLNLK